jgi:hypothetical protein
MGKDAHPAFDMWSLGITLYVLMARTEPYPIDYKIRFDAILQNRRK